MDKPKTRISQTDFPAYTLEQALRVSYVIRDEYAKQAVSPLDLAKALKMSPSSGGFRTLTSASVAYGLTTSGGQSKTPIELTELAKRIVSPQVENDAKRAKVESFLKPRINREFLSKYSENSLPSMDIAKNVLESMGVPVKMLDKVLEQILSSANELSILDDIAGKKYVRLGGVNVSKEDEDGGPTDIEIENPIDQTPDKNVKGDIAALSNNTQSTTQNNKVFITHGSNRKIVDQIKEVLTFGKFIPVVSIEKEAVAKPVPDKVMDDMRSCGAAIVHVGSEKTMLDQNGTEHKIINQNVLIEIGAAMALFGRKFILLVEDGTMLPSNLQGLYEVRYSGEELDYVSTMKLLKAFNEFHEQS